MTSSPSTRQPADERSVVRTGVRSILDSAVTIAAAAVVFLTGALTTLFALQAFLWEILRKDVTEVMDGATIIAVTPFDVIFLQVRVAVVVGFVLAVETLVVRYWWARSSLPSGVRLLLALVGAALFPVGAVLGYEYAFPVVLAALGDVGSTWSIVRWGALACYVSIASGVVAQVSLVLGVRTLPPFGVDGIDGS